MKHIQTNFVTATLCTLHFRGKLGPRLWQKVRIYFLSKTKDLNSFSENEVQKNSIQTNTQVLVQNKNEPFWFVCTTLLRVRQCAGWLCLLAWKTILFPSKYHRENFLDLFNLDLLFFRYFFLLHVFYSLWSSKLLFLCFADNLAHPFSIRHE